MSLSVEDPFVETDARWVVECEVSANGVRDLRSVMVMEGNATYRYFNTSANQKLLQNTGLVGRNKPEEDDKIDSVSSLNPPPSPRFTLLIPAYPSKRVVFLK